MSRIASTKAASSIALLRRVADAPLREVLELLKTSQYGLTDAEAEERAEKIGRNEVAREKPPKWYVQLWEAFSNPFSGLLVVLGVVSYFSDVRMAPPGKGDWTKVILLSLMISLSGLMKFAQGESLPVEKYDKFSNPENKPVPVGNGPSRASEGYPRDIDAGKNKGDLLESSTLCFMGTNDVSGTAMGAVVNTGDRTLFGSMATSILGHRTMTSFDEGVRKVSWVLIRFTVFMVPIVFVVNGLTKHNWTDSLLFALAVAVGVTPELLPMVVSANLAKGSIKMAKRKVIVKRLNSDQNLGAMDILCTDKTGTLTEDRVVLERHLDVTGQDSHEVLRLAFLNSYHQTGGYRRLASSPVMPPRGESMRCFKVLPEHLEDYRKAGLTILKCGEEAIVDISSFNLSGQRWKSLRYTWNKMKKAGFRVEFYEPQLEDWLMEEIEDVSREWLSARKIGEKRFSPGWFEPEIVKHLEVSVAFDSHGRVSGFLTFVPMYNLDQVSPDLMRYRPLSPTGIIDLLLVESARHYSQKGFSKMNLGLAPLAHITPDEKAAWTDKAIKVIADSMPNLRGLYLFKEKYNPVWEPRYMAYPGALTLPKIALAVVRAGNPGGLTRYIRRLASVGRKNEREGVSSYLGQHKTQRSAVVFPQEHLIIRESWVNKLPTEARQG